MSRRRVGALLIVATLLPRPAPAATAPGPAPPAPREEPVGSAVAATPSPHEALLRRALSRFRAAEYAAAAADLARLHATSPEDGDVALLLGIALYRDGRPDAAEPPLRVAAGATDAETATAARLYLGLVDRDRGNADAARAELSASQGTRSPLLADAGRALLVATAPRLLTLTFLLRAGFDSNVPLLPGTALAPGALAGRADGDLLLLAAVSLRPLSSIGLTLDESASFRKQLTLSAFDLFSNLLGARYAWLGERDRVQARYGFELMTLGGSLYTLGHVAQLGYRRAFLGGLGAIAGYTFRYRGYPGDDFRAFTGPSHQGTLGLGLGTDESPLQVELRFVALREDTEEAAYSATGLGGTLLIRARLGTRVGLSGTGSAIHRLFDEVAGSGLPRRVDWQLHGDVVLTVDLHRYLGLLLGASALRNLSGPEPWDADYDSLKLTAWAGLAAGWAGP